LREVLPVILSAAKDLSARQPDPKLALRMTGLLSKCLSAGKPLRATCHLAVFARSGFRVLEANILASSQKGER
jgi:hypothetical protein